MRASPWKSGNAALGKFGLVGHLRPFWTLWTLNHSSGLGPWALSLLCWSALLRSASRFFLDRVFSEACAHVGSQLFHALGFGSWPGPARSPSAVWPHSCPPLPLWKSLLRNDVQALLEARPEPIFPIPATGPAPRLAHLRPRSRLPKAAPSRPRGSILLNQRGSAGLSVKSSPVAPPDRSVSSCRHSCSSAPANGPCRVTEHGWRGSQPHTARVTCRSLCSHRDRCSEGKSEASCLRRRRSEATQEGQAPPPGATTILQLHTESGHPIFRASTANQLSVYGAIADLCHELSEDFRASGKPEAPDHVETMEIPAGPSIAETQTNAQQRRNLVQEYERKFEQMSEDQKLPNYVPMRV